jgi:hypothetical protein
MLSGECQIFKGEFKKMEGELDRSLEVIHEIFRRADEHREIRTGRRLF